MTEWMRLWGRGMKSRGFLSWLHIGITWRTLKKKSWCLRTIPRNSDWIAPGWPGAMFEKHWPRVRRDPSKEYGGPQHLRIRPERKVKSAGLPWSSRKHRSSGASGVAASYMLDSDNWGVQEPTNQPTNHHSSPKRPSLPTKVFLLGCIRMKMTAMVKDSGTKSACQRREIGKGIHACICCALCLSPYIHTFIFLYYRIAAVV